MRVVAKIGTSSITDERGRDRRRRRSPSWPARSPQLRADGHEVIVVSSGAVAAGVAALGLAVPARPTCATLQALSAAGQSRLMRSWDTAARRPRPRAGAGAARSRTTSSTGAQYLHARRTLTRLLELGCVPIINENDAIASDEIRYGDNDRLAALVAHNVGADVLVLLTDLDGPVHRRPPRRRRRRSSSAAVAADDPLLAIRAGRGGSGRGSGGMASKLAAARIASWSGVRTVIANAARAGVLAGAVAGDVGRHHVRGPPPQAAGAQAVDRLRRPASPARCRSTTAPGGRSSSARRACSRPASSTSSVASARATRSTSSAPTASPFARGMVFVDAAVLRQVAGRHTSDLPAGMAHEVIHRDDLVVLPAELGPGSRTPVRPRSAAPARTGQAAAAARRGRPGLLDGRRLGAAAAAAEAELGAQLAAAGPGPRRWPSPARPRAPATRPTSRCSSAVALALA